MTNGMPANPLCRAVKARGDALPRNLPPRGLSRPEAAAYIGVSPSLFDMMVRDGRMPRPKSINSRTIWDIRQIDKAFTALPGGDADDDWEAE